jgi:hypothetical protein
VWSLSITLRLCRAAEPGVGVPALGLLCEPAGLAAPGTRLEADCRGAQVPGPRWWGLWVSGGSCVIEEALSAARALDSATSSIATTTGA